MVMATTNISKIIKKHSDFAIFFFDFFGLPFVVVFEYFTERQKFIDKREFGKRCLSESVFFPCFCCSWHGKIHFDLCSVELVLRKRTKEFAAY